jgi:hypothetical protein
MIDRDRHHYNEVTMGLESKIQLEDARMRQGLCPVCGKGPGWLARRLFLTPYCSRRCRDWHKSTGA